MNEKNLTISDSFNLAVQNQQDDDTIVSVVGDEDHQYASVKVLKRQLQ